MAEEVVSASSTSAGKPLPASRPAAEQTVLAVLCAISFSHLLNDTIQALIPSLYPLLKQNNLYLQSRAR